MIKGTTKSGFEFAIDEHRLDDMELFDLIAESDDNPAIMPKVLSKLFGAEQKKRLYEFCRGEKGNVSIEKTMQVMEEIFQAVPTLKKS